VVDLAVKFDFEAKMQDIVNTLMLICAAIASLGLGVLLAYAFFRVGFSLLRAQAQPNEVQVVSASTQTAEV
jgi:hypothetical protein